MEDKPVFLVLTSEGGLADSGKAGLGGAVTWFPLGAMGPAQAEPRSLAAIGLMETDLGRTYSGLMGNCNAVVVPSLPSTAQPFPIL